MSQAETFIESVDARTRLVGANQMELLLFSLGTRETFGINVFKVREVGRVPTITPCPNMPQGVVGLISLRGNVIPVIALLEVIGLGSGSPGETMLVAEFSRRTVAFLVRNVDRIHRVAWERVHQADGRLAQGGVPVTAIVDLPDGRIASMLDVEQIMANTFGEDIITGIQPVSMKDVSSMVFFVDDSLVARKQIAEVLDQLHVQHRHANNGQEAWTRLLGIASGCDHAGTRVADEIDVILVDAEMPEMDGYVLTRNIKNDPRFNDVPVIMHSSLSSEANRALGHQAGVDAYVAKFEAASLADTVCRHLQGA